MMFHVVLIPVKSPNHKFNILNVDIFGLYTCFQMMCSISIPRPITLISKYFFLHNTCLEKNRKGCFLPGVGIGYIGEKEVVGDYALGIWGVGVRRWEGTRQSVYGEKSWDFDIAYHSTSVVSCKCFNVGHIAAMAADQPLHPGDRVRWPGGAALEAADRES